MSLKQQSGAPVRVNSFFPFSGNTWRAVNWSLGEHMPVYYDRLDKVYTDVTPTVDRFLGFDPTMEDATSPASALSPTGASQDANWAIGEWDRVGNTQNVYNAPNTGLNKFARLDSAGANPALAVADADPFAADLNERSSPGASSQIGYKTDLAGVAGCSTVAGNVHVFETAGYALQAGIAVRHTDNSFYCNVLAQIDLTTGLCDPNTGNGTGRIVPDIPIFFTTSPTDFQAPTLFGETIIFDSVQFVPDDDSTPAVPKGRLILSSGSPSNPSLTSGNNRDIWIRVVEWNPTGASAVPGNPSRTQARVLLTSRFTVLLNTEPESGGLGSSFSGATRAVFHPPTETVRVYVHDSAGSDEVMDVYELAAEFSSLSTPTAESTPRTGTVATFSSSASGDLGEPIINRPVDWALARVSEAEELVDTAGLPAVSTLAETPIDDDDQIRITDNDGNLLVKGAGPGGDFTVNVSTGDVTWQNGPNGNHPKAESGYTASYNHRTSEVTPPHGTLLNTRSNTDENGKAIARVQYPADDDLVDALDKITSTDAGV